MILVLDGGGSAERRFWENASREFGKRPPGLNDVLRGSAGDVGDEGGSSSDSEDDRAQLLLSQPYEFIVSLDRKPNKQIICDLIKNPPI